MLRSSKPEAADPAACERSAVHLLTRREHSRLELRRKLAARGFEEDLVESTLDRLEAAGLLDAGRFMESFIDSRAVRGKGPIRIRAELLERGVAGDAAAEALRNAAHDWFAVAARTRAKRFGADAPSDFKERARQARFLQYRGFDAAQINAALELGSDSD